MAGESQTTTDHKQIQKWAEERGAKPSTVTRTMKDDDVGVIRLNFPGYDEESLEEISWEQFFDKFEDNDLAFLYQETKSDGQQSNFFKFIKREGARKGK